MSPSSPTMKGVIRGKMILKPGGQGIEGIMFVPDSRHPEGGTFSVTNQLTSFQGTTRKA